MRNKFAPGSSRPTVFQLPTGSQPRAQRQVASINPFTAGNPFWGTSLLGFSIGRGLGALKGLNELSYSFIQGLGMSEGVRRHPFLG